MATATKIRGSVWTGKQCAVCGKVVWAVRYSGGQVWLPALEHKCVGRTVLPVEALQVVEEEE